MLKKIKQKIQNEKISIKLLFTLISGCLFYLICKFTAFLANIPSDITLLLSFIIFIMSLVGLIGFNVFMYKQYFDK